MFAPSRRLRVLPPQLVEVVQGFLALLLQALVGLLVDDVILLVLIGAAHHVRPVRFHRVVALVVGKHLIVDRYRNRGQLRWIVTLGAHVTVRNRLCKLINNWI